MRVCVCAGERERCFSVLRKPLSLCPRSLCAVLGSSVPVWSLQLHAWRGALVDMSHGWGGSPRYGGVGGSALAWHLLVRGAGLSQGSSGSYKMWSSSPRGLAALIARRIPGVPQEPAKFPRGRAAALYQATGKRPCTGFWGPPGCCGGRRSRSGRSHCSGQRYGWIVPGLYYLALPLPKMT